MNIRVQELSFKMKSLDCFDVGLQDVKCPSQGSYIWNDMKPVTRQKIQK